jgi:hypothetical protein
MDEVIFLFLYHQLNEVTLRHHALLRQFHPRDEIVPLGYQLTIPKVLPGTVDVALDWDYGWPIRSVWHEVDKIFLRWFRRKDRPSARRYVFFEYDILVNSTAPEFYASSWNSDLAAVSIKRPKDDPSWPWWRHGPRLGVSEAHWCGVVPMSATMWSNEAFTRLAASNRFQDCYCELRMGTLARMLGLHLEVIPNAFRSVSWRERDITVDQRRTWFHPVKNIEGQSLPNIALPKEVSP